VFVKRAQPRAMRLLRSLGKRVVYDVLDSWRQPEDDLAVGDAAAALRLFSGWLPAVPADGVIFPNVAMRNDLGGLVRNPVTIYHHFRPGLTTIAIRERATAVGYEGDLRYLGPWRPAAERACRALGLRFVVNPSSWRDVDLGFAARGRPHASFLSRRYKSNVKLANFYGAGIPCVLAPEASYRETDDGSVRFCRRPEGLERELRALLPRATRSEIHASFLETRQRFRLEAVAEAYASYFEALLGSPSQFAR